MPEKSVFLKPDLAESAHTAHDVERADSDRLNSTEFVYNRYIHLTISEQRARLPIYKVRQHFLYLIESRQVIVLLGETGSGKSTQIPQYLLEAGWCEDCTQICVVQSKRMAAISLAARVSTEVGCSLGSTVGYAVRFASKLSETTRIKYVTEGVLIKELMCDPLLHKYCVVILDEVHERTLSSDLIMSLMKKILQRRLDLRLVVCSATADIQLLQKYFTHKPASLTPLKCSTPAAGSQHDQKLFGSPLYFQPAVLCVTGRQYPVQINYSLSPVADYVRSALDTALHVHRTQPLSGDILVFLTGQEEVDEVVQQLTNHTSSDKKREALVLPIYGSLSRHDQMKVFQRSSAPNTRKIIVSTNLAESAITIPNIVYVIDCGFVKQRYYNPDTHIESLVVTPISKASANQRAGRAGRVKPGFVFRLYTEQSYEKLLPEATEPEIRRTCLAPIVLLLRAFGVHNFVRHSMPSAPPIKSMLAAVELLYATRAMNEDSSLTALGSTMSQMFLSPLHSFLIVKAAEFDCVVEACVVVAALRVEGIFVIPKPGQALTQSRIKHRYFQVEEGDLLTYLNVYRSFCAIPESRQRSWCQSMFINYRVMLRVHELVRQLMKLAKVLGIKFDFEGKGSSESVLKAVCAAMFTHAVYYDARQNAYRSTRSNDILLHIHPSSVLYTLDPSPWLIYNEVLHSNKCFMRDLTRINPDWLIKFAPHFYKYYSVR